MNENLLIKELQYKISVYQDMAAYKELYKLLYDRLFWFSYSFVKTKEAAEEVVSDVFVTVWKMRDNLTSINNLRVYIFTITRNISLNYITKHYKYPKIDLNEIEFETVSSIGNPEELLASAELAKRIKEAIEQLPPQCRLIFQMVKENELKPKEVAAILHISELTVRNQLVIAAGKIAQTLQLTIGVQASKSSRHNM
jgi:RNA polymerase sigma-70 factor (family 1)